MQMTRREIDGVVILSFADDVELEGDGSRHFREKVRGALTSEAPSLCLDLGRVTFIDSSGLGALVGALKSLRERGGHLCLANVPPHVREVLSVTGIARVMALRDTVEDCLRDAKWRDGARDAAG